MSHPAADPIQSFLESSALYNHAISEIMEGLRNVDLHGGFGSSEKVQPYESLLAQNIVVRDIAERGIMASGGWVDKTTMEIIPPAMAM